LAEQPLGHLLRHDHTHRGADDISMMRQHGHGENKMTKIAIMLLTLALVIPALAKDKPLTPTYDKFQNRTLFAGYVSEVDRVKHSGQSWGDYGLGTINLGAVFACPGNNIDGCTPGRVVLNFSAITKQWIFQSGATLTFFVDGQRVGPVAAEKVSGSVSNFFGSDNRPMLDENVLVLVPPDFFTKLANASVVEMQMNGFEFSLNKENFFLLKQVAEHLKGETK
jgi:hypothetical protein